MPLLETIRRCIVCNEHYDPRVAEQELRHLAHTFPEVPMPGQVARSSILDRIVVTLEDAERLLRSESEHCGRGADGLALSALATEAFKLRAALVGLRHGVRPMMPREPVTDPKVLAELARREAANDDREPLPGANLVRSEG